jgi:hypothetical protein
VSKIILYCLYLTRAISSYGPKGGAIIQSTLMRMFNPATTPSDGFAPLSLGQFSQLILVPYVARLLIMEDLTCSMTEAYQEMVDSSDAGRSLYPEDDEDLELECILDTNVREATKERTAKLRMDADVSAPTHNALRMLFRIDIDSCSGASQSPEEKCCSIPKGTKLQNQSYRAGY